MIETLDRVARKKDIFYVLFPRTHAPKFERNLKLDISSQRWIRFSYTKITSS